MSVTQQRKLVLSVPVAPRHAELTYARAALNNRTVSAELRQALQPYFRQLEREHKHDREHAA